MLQNHALPEGLTFPEPVFSLWQQVRANYFDENYSITEDEGFVIGLYYSIGLETEFQRGWVYYIYWYKAISCPWLSPPVIDVYLENELLPLSPLEP